MYMCGVCDESGQSNVYALRIIIDSIIISIITTSSACCDVQVLGCYKRDKRDTGL